MSTKIFIAPYVEGPEPDPAADRVLNDSRWRFARGMLRESISRLHPRVQWERSISMFIVEGLAIALFLGTLAVVSAGAKIGVVPRLLLLAADLALLLSLLAGNLALTLSERLRQKKLASRGAAPGARVYRVMNYAARAATDRPMEKARRNAAADPGNYVVLEVIDSERLQVGDVMLVESGQIIHADGDILDGIALVDESAVTGESAPVVRGSGILSEVMRDTRVISGRIFVRMTPRKGHPLDWNMAVAAPAAIETSQHKPRFLTRTDATAKHRGRP